MPTPRQPSRPPLATPAPRSLPRPRLPFKRLGVQLDGLTRKAFTKFGFADDHVITRWHEIVGPELARLTSPERLSRPQKGISGGSTLTVRVAGAAALELQHMAPQIIDKINGFYGRPMVARLKLVQGPLPAELEPRLRRARGQVQQAGGQQPRQPLFGAPPLQPIVDGTANIDDPELAEALARLAKAVSARPK